MNAAERSRTLLPVLVVLQLSTGCIQPLVRGAIVSSEHLKVGRQIHSTQITPIQAGKCSSLRNGSPRRSNPHERKVAYVDAGRKRRSRILRLVSSKRTSG